MINKNLSEQLLQFFGNEDNIPGNVRPLLVHISKSYDALESNERFLEELKKRNSDLDHFAHTVSHDLKAPLRAISSLSEMIEENIDGNRNETKQHLDMLRSRVNKMIQLINGVLDYSRVGREKTQKEIVQVKQLIAEVAESLGILPSLTLNVQEEIPKIFTERIRLSQVFSNLLSNAVKYCDKPDVEIEISCVDFEDWCQFSVKDNGPGIPSGFHEKIFGMFQTLESRQRSDSTGIGLTIVKKIVEEQGGKIWVESEPGKGTSFVFTWNKNSIKNI